MTLLSSVDNHKYLNYTQDVVDICKPLFDLTGINCFLYIRVYDDGKRYQIGTHSSWLQHYIKNDYCIQTCLTHEVNTIENHYILYESCMDNIVFQAAVNDFGMHNGIILTNRIDDFIEYIHFATAKDNKEILQFYINHIDYIDKFVIYFKNTAKSILNDVKPFVLKQKLTLQKSPLNVISLLCKEKLNENIYLDNLEIQVNNRRILLSKHEINILAMYLHGRTAKEIANDICRSNRTVEYHLNQIKKKLKCGHRSGIFEIVNENNLFNTLYHYGNQFNHVNNAHRRNH